VQDTVTIFEGIYEYFRNLIIYQPGQDFSHLPHRGKGKR